ncbi:hypothetical protein DFJ74DRAFT_60738 [Hyaloraphidium curvatum]|nr:hypothetical protein DFJ74DRAFT_60738 [Hyaloraphidium curvatum]
MARAPSPGGASVVTLVADAGVGTAGTKRKFEDDGLAQSQPPRPPPWAAQACSRKRPRDWDDDGGDVVDEPPPYADFGASHRQGWGAPPDYKDCQPPTKRARHAHAAEDWKASVMDSLGRPVPKAAPPSTSFYVYNAAAFEKPLAAVPPELAPPEPPLESHGPHAGLGSSTIHQKLQALVDSAGTWIQHLRDDPGGRARRTDHPRQPGTKWTSRVASFLRKGKG